MNIKSLLLSTTISLLCATTAPAQQIIKQDEKPYIEVNGYAEKEVIPNEIYISITLQERYDGRNKITVQDQEEQLKKSVKTLGIDLTNLTLSDADAAYQRVKWLSKDVIAKKTYQLKVTTADMVGHVFDELDKLNIKDAGIDHVDYANKENLKKELKITAIKNAKEKAQYLLAAIDATAGKPLYVREEENTPVYPMARMMYDKVATRSEAPAPTDDSNYIEYQKMKFTSTVYTKFEIK